jgi:hypothetical protein
MAGFYVRRVKRSTPGGFAWVGPIRSERQAEREAATWNAAGAPDCGSPDDGVPYDAVVLPSSPDVRRQVQEWQASVQARRDGYYARGFQTAGHVIAPTIGDDPRFTHGRFSPRI